MVRRTDEDRGWKIEDGAGPLAVILHPPSSIFHPRIPPPTVPPVASVLSVVEIGLKEAS
jgi:hypothetical protein